MYQKTAAEHFAEAMTRLTKQPHPFARTAEVPVHPQTPPSTSRPFTISISREAGAGGITVAREVGRRLSWPVYDQEIMESLAKELNVDVSSLEEYDERPGSFLVDTIKSFSAAAGVTEVAYFRRLVHLFQVLGARGECLLVGRGSSFILPMDTTLRVRIVASRDDRIAFLVRDAHMSPAEAARFVDTHDRDRSKFIKDHFHKDAADPQNYDLIINRSRFNVDETAELVIEALQRMQARKAAAMFENASSRP